MSHAEMRNNFFRLAAAAYVSGDGAAAKLYADKGREHGLLMREAHAQASQDIYGLRNVAAPPSDVMQVDLHGLTVNEALDVVESLLEKFKSEQHDKARQLLRPTPRFLSIVTGVGHHSAGGVARIRPAVISYLRKRGSTFNESRNSGVLVVKLRN